MERVAGVTMQTGLKFALSSAVIIAAGCTNTGLHRDVGPPPPPPKETITVQGTFCTEDPETLKFPVKVWFILDDSGSMGGNDPNRARATATITLAQQLEDTGPNPAMFFGGEIFSGAVGAIGINPPPDRFLSSAAAFATNVNAAVTQGNGNTPYLAALNFAFGELSADINVDPVLSRRTRYVVIFLSDGAPTDSGPPEIIAAVQNLMSLRDRAGDVTVNTVFLGGGGGGEEQLLMAMAQTGLGIYKSFPNGDALDFTDFDFSSIRRNYNQRFFMLTNVNALPTTRGHLPDSDADGLGDFREEDLGTDILLADTDADGCGDLFETRDAGWDPLIPGTQNNQCVCTAAQRVTDTDSDGLSDCEEKWIGSGSVYPDTDKNEDDTVIGDLVWDGLDHKYLNDVLFPNDGMDYDADGFQDLQELRTHTDPHGNDDAREDWAYDYVFLDQQPENPRCYDFQIDNVSIMQTDSGENDLLLYYAQSPQDNAQKEKSFRIAHKIVQYSNLHTVDVVPEDFTEVLIANPPVP